jgi:NAD+ synthase (glutamine-hydrolysing)
MTKPLITRRLRIGMAQINATVGDFAGNRHKIIAVIEEAKSSGVDILTFPELAICGYPPEDLLFKPQFIADNLKSLEKVVEASAGITLVVGFVDANHDTYNAAAVIHDGRHIGTYHKMFLPNYGVFDENRYFQAGNESPVFTLAGINIGINICEDIWYESGPATAQTYSGAELIINISASPYHFDKANLRERMITTRAADNVAIFAFNNMVGGQDELVFDGNSLIVDEKGQIIARGKHFQEDLIIADLDIESVFRARLHDPRLRKGQKKRKEQELKEAKTIIITEAAPKAAKPPLLPCHIKIVGPIAEVYEALVLGTRDYVLKNGFKKVVLGLSGGIDSSLVAAIATDALDKSNIIGVAMPSRYSSPGSLADAELLSKNLGIKLYTIPIEKVFQAYLDTFTDPFKGTKTGITEENLQARIRGNFLMALSNKFGWLVLTTGNKSEYATGYTTLYGDMAGGFAVIKDVPKTMVYKLAAYRNGEAGMKLIPDTIIQKPPSAELRPDQKDTDSLPPYETLDPILTAYVEEDKSIEQIIKSGADERIVRLTARLVDRSEYKRRQAPPGVKITPRAFGRDRRLPITNQFKKD